MTTSAKEQYHAMRRQLWAASKAGPDSYDRKLREAVELYPAVFRDTLDWLAHFEYAAMCYGAKKLELLRYRYY